MPRALPPVALLLVVALAAPLAVGAQSPVPRNAATALAESWSGGRSAPACRTNGPRGEVLGTPDARYCEWATPAGGGTVVANVYLGGGPSLVTWERPTTGAADADRVIDSLGAALVARGLAADACGESDVPAGRVRGLVWVGAHLLVHLSRIAPPEGAPRLYVVATDDPNVFPMETMCPTRARSREEAELPAGMMIGDGLAVLLRPDRLEGITRYELDGDAVLTVVRYRTGGPAADSAEARRTLTAALAGTRGFERRTRDGRLDPASARLIVRPCYDDHCPPARHEEDGVVRPGDFVFAPASDGSWVPAPPSPSSPSSPPAPPTRAGRP